MPDSIALRIISGPRAGESFEIRRGLPAVVGRSPEATVWLDEPAMSRRHFQITWDGHTCRLRDLNSRTGVVVNGHRVMEAILRSGDRIEVGQLSCTVDLPVARRRIVEDTLRAPAPEPPLDEPPRDTLLPVAVPLAVFDNVAPTMAAGGVDIPPDSLAAGVIRTCRTGGGRLYALVDGAQSFELAFSARLMGHRLYTLFSGALATDLAHVGPCLVELGRPEAFLLKWTAAIGSHAGVLLQSDAELDELYAHLRSIFVVTDEEGQEYFFRYYDPRVLRVFLPTCTESELREFFGPVDRWVAEDEEGKGLTLFAVRDGRLFGSALGARAHVQAPAGS